jgi:PAS domain S-box-containing protein
MAQKIRCRGSERSELPPRIARVIEKYKKLLPEAERMASFPILNPNPVCEVDFSGKVTFYNRACAAVLKKYGAGKSIRALFPPDIKQILKLSRRKGKLQLTRKIRIKDAIFVEGIHIAPKYNAIRFYLRDITDRENTEKALRESEERFKSLFQGLPISTVVFQKTGKDFVIKDYNRASVEFTEGKMPRYLGQSAKKLYAANPEILEKFNLAIKRRTPQVLQTSYVMLSTGRPIYLHLKLAFVPPDRIIMHSEDITDQKEAADKLRFQARILSAVNDAVIVADTGFRITYWNKAAERIYGWKAEEAMGKLSKDVMHSEMPARDRGAIYKNLRRGKPVLTELIQYTRQNQKLIIDGYTIPLKNNRGEITDFVAINRDITVRKGYEKALQDTKENLENRVRQRTAELERARSGVEAERQRLYDVLETLPVYVVLLDKGYHVPFANRFFRERFGESRGRRCYEYLFGRKSPCPVCESFVPFKTRLPHRWEWTGPDCRNYDIYDFPFRESDGSFMIMEMGIDVTEQKQAQDALRRVNEYHRKLIEVSLDPLVTISADGKITDVNEATIKATGLPREKLLGTDFSDYFTEPKKAREGYRQVFARGFVADYPLTIRHRNGGLKDVLYNASVYKDEQNKILGVFAAARDVTVLKKAEAELRKNRDHLEELVRERTRDLRESELQLRTIYASMTEGLANHEVVYRDGQPVDYVITEVNPAYENITGLTRAQALGKKASTLYGTDALPYLNIYARVAECGAPESFETYFAPMKKHFAISVFSPEKGKFATVFSDITERKRADDELRQSDHRLKRAEAIAHLGGWELDLAGNRLTWSDEVYRIFGLKPQEFGATYDAFLEHVHPDDRTAVDEAYTSSLSEGRDSYEIEHRVVRKDNGEIRWVHERCEHQRDADGRVVRSVGMVHDITTRKRSENEMRSLNERLENINEQLKDFVFTVSHDLKAPLRTIQGYTDALQEDYGDKLDEAGRVHIGRIAAAVQRLDTMIQDLLAYSRLSSEQVVIETVDLETVVRETLEGLQPEVALKKAKFTVVPGLPQAGAHPSTLHQVVENLILNAITYVKPGVEPDVRIWSETQGDWVYLYFKDNGIGIAAENQERIFKVFERLHGVESYPGTGVGLAIVKKGIERMGGKLGVVSTPGEGSTFWIALPRVDLAKEQ